MRASDVKKGDRVRVTFTKGPDFRPARGCTKSCCEMETTETGTVWKVWKKAGKVDVRGEAGGGYAFYPESDWVVSCEKVS